MSRLRLQHFIVQPALVWDDGEELRPGPEIQPQPLTLAGLKDLADTWSEKLAELEKQANDSA